MERKIVKQKLLSEIDAEMKQIVWSNELAED
jgi:hypothetical protein